MTVFSFLFSDQIAAFLGASGELVSLTSDYLRYYILFGIFFCMAMVLAAFVRNDGSPKLGFSGMAAGLGQVISCMIMLPHFIHGKGKLTRQKNKVCKPVSSLRPPFFEGLDKFA